jgi:hypothetical protein
MPLCFNGLLQRNIWKAKELAMKLSFNRTSLGALMGSLGLCLMFVAAPMSAGAASTPAAEAAPAATGAKYGTVWRIRGEVTATKPGAPVRKLREGDPVYVGERLRAASRSRGRAAHR